MSILVDKSITLTARQDNLLNINDEARYVGAHIQLKVKGTLLPRKKDGPCSGHRAYPSRLLSCPPEENLKPVFPADLRTLKRARIP
jgi:hypothetical protein